MFYISAKAPGSAIGIAEIKISNNSTTISAKSKPAEFFSFFVESLKSSLS